MKNLKAILFDMDGTLVDSEISHFNSWKELLLLAGNEELSYESYLMKYAGVSAQNNAQKLIEEFKIAEPLEQLIKKREELILKILQTKEIKLMPHAWATLRSMADLGIPLGLVTSSSRTVAAIVLTRTKLQDFFKLIVTRDDVVHAKPHPEPYRKALEILGFKSEDCLAIEDSLIGIQSAKSAGLACVAVQQRSSIEYKNKCAADVLFENLWEVNEYICNSFLKK